MKRALLALGMCVLIVALLVGGVFVLNPPVQAAQAQAPTPISDNCEEVATVGIIEYYYCETDYGDFFTNSFGFMLPE